MAGKPRARLLVDGRDVAALEVAGSYGARARGLLGRDGLDGALLLRPLNWVHTFRMRFPIDVAHLDADGVVLRTTTMLPNRPGRPVWGARAVLETEAGQLAAWRVRVGARVSPRPGAEDAPA